MSGRWYQWTGGDYTPELAAFLKQQPDVIYWAEEQLFIPVALPSIEQGPGAVLVVSYELSTEHPIRIPSGWWLHFDGHHISAFEKGPEPQGPASYNVLDAAEGKDPWSYGRPPGVGGG